MRIRLSSFGVVLLGLTLISADVVAMAPDPAGAVSPVVVGSEPFWFQEGDDASDVADEVREAAEPTDPSDIERDGNLPPGVPAPSQGLAEDSATATERTPTDAGGDRGDGVVVSGPQEEGPIQRPAAIMPNRTLEFGTDGKATAQDAEQGDGLKDQIRLTRPETDSTFPVELVTLNEVQTGAVSSIGFAFSLNVTGEMKEGKTPEIPQLQEDGSRSQVDLGKESGWEVRFDLDLFADTINEVGRVVFYVSFGCDNRGNCDTKELLPSRIDNETSEVVVQIPSNVMAAISRSPRVGTEDAEDTDGQDTGIETSEVEEEDNESVPEESDPVEVPESDPAVEPNETPEPIEGDEPGGDPAEGGNPEAEDPSDPAGPNPEGDRDEETNPLADNPADTQDPAEQDVGTAPVGKEDEPEDDPDQANADSALDAEPLSEEKLPADNLVAGESQNTPTAGEDDQVKGKALPANLLAFAGGDNIFFGASGGSGASTGNYAASAFASLSTNQVGLLTGHAELSYSLTLPPALGHIPSLTYGYSSGAVDGMNSATNNQPSQIGIGWADPTPIITRETRGCGNTGNEAGYVGNLCLPNNNRLDGFHVSFSGVSSPLIRTSSATGTNHPDVTGAKYWTYETKQANNWRIRRVEHAGKYNTAAGNGDVWTTWWEITTADGTLYVFGREHQFVPNGGTSGPAPTRQRTASTASIYDGPSGSRSDGTLRSAQTVPVWIPSANANGLSCQADLCDVAISWRLDQVIDINGNSATYHYWNETNYYKPLVGGAYQSPRQYERNINSWYIDYGGTYGSQAPGYAATTPFRVRYDYLGRHTGADVVANYVDTPMDLRCASNGDGCTNIPPSFFSQYRMRKVTSLVSGAEKLNYTFNNSWPTAPGEGGLAAGEKSLQKLWLDSIQQKGGTQSLPPISMGYTWMNNRVNHPTGVSAMQMPRVGTFTTEYGALTTYTYGQSHPPTSGSSDPCYKLQTTHVRLPCDMFVAYDAYTGGGGYVFWNKWKVTKDVLNPRNGGSQVITTNYEYPDAPDWAFSGRTGHGPHATGQSKVGYGSNLWNEYRGHRRVIVTDAAGNKTTHFFFTGMQNDRYSVGNNAWLSSVAGSTTPAQVRNPFWSLVDNTFELAGRSLGSKSVNQLGQTVSITVLEYTTAGVTAGAAVYPKSYRTITTEQTTYYYNTPGSSSTTNSYVKTTFDSRGRVVRVQDKGVAGSSDDRTIITEYVENTSNWVLVPKLISTKNYNLNSGNPWGYWISATAFLYDGGTFSQSPTYGRVSVQHQQIRQNSSGQPIWSDTTFTYTAKGQLLTEKALGASGSADDQTTTYSYNSTYGYMVWEDGPLSGTVDKTTYTVDPAFGVPLTVKDPNNKTTTMTYDGLGRLKTVKYPGAPKASTKFTYGVSTSGVDWVKTETLRLSGATDEYVSSWEFFDGMGRIIQSQSRHVSDNAKIKLVSSRYDNVGRLLATTKPTFRTGTPGTFKGENWSNPAVAHTRHTYPTTADSTVNQGCTTGYNAVLTEYGPSNTTWGSTRSTTCGLLIRTWDLDGHRTVSETDVRGNIVETTNQRGESTSHTYNNRDQIVTTTDAGSNTTTTEYFRWETQPTELDDPDLGEVTYQYDLFGRLSEQISGVGSVEGRLVVTYDKANRPLNTWHNGTQVARWTYDQAGAYGLVSRAEHWNVNAITDVQEGEVQQDFDYDSRLRLSKVTSTIPNLPGGTQDIDYTYRENGGIDKITYPNGTIADYGYNRLEQAQDLKLGTGEKIVRWAGYNASNQLTNLNRGESGTQIQLDTTLTYGSDTHWLNSIRSKHGSNDVQYLSYIYNADGNIKRIRDRSNGADQRQCFHYDNLHRLTDGYTRLDDNCNGTVQWSGTNPYNVDYAYNSLGNITSASGTNTPGGSYSYAGSDQPHAVSSAGGVIFTYNDAGSMKRRQDGADNWYYKYDVMGMLQEINAPGSNNDTDNLYTASGVRAKRTIGTQNSFYLGDGYEVLGSGDVVLNLSFAGQNVGVIDDGTTWLQAVDHLGSPNHSRKANGSVKNQNYLPFGGVRGGAASNQPSDLSFTGQTNDQGTLLLDFKARQYDPWLGRFIQADTVISNLHNGQDLNRFSYVRNNPINLNDPSGHDPVSACLAGGSAGLVGGPGGATAGCLTGLAVLAAAVLLVVLISVTLPTWQGGIPDLSLPDWELPGFGGATVADSFSGIVTETLTSVQSLPQVPGFTSIGPVGPMLLAAGQLNNNGVPYPSIADPRNPGFDIPYPSGDYGWLHDDDRVRRSNAAKTEYQGLWEAGNPTPNGGWEAFWSDHEVHHIQPVAFGGTNAQENLVHLLKGRGNDHQDFSNWWRGNK